MKLGSPMYRSPRLYTGGCFLRAPPVFPGVDDVEDDLSAGCPVWSQIVRACSRVADFPLGSARRARRWIRKVDEDTRPQPDGFKELMAFLGKSTSRGGSAPPFGVGHLQGNRGSTSFYKKIRAQLRQARNCSSGAAPDDPCFLIPPSMWTQPPRETPRCHHVCQS